MIDELIERVEKGEGADRELEIAVWRQFNDAPANREPLPWLCCYTESIDAVTALIKERLPGWAYAAISEKLRGCIGYVHNNEPAFVGGTARRNHARRWFETRATSPARALLAAFLKAHKEQHDGR